MVTKLGPPVFLVGLVLLIATLAQLLLAHGRIPNYGLNSLIAEHWVILNPHPLWSGNSWIIADLGWLVVTLTAAGTVLAWRVDINEFSMHHFYKNRLVRCYLGASHVGRNPNPFTGFDERDDLHLNELTAVDEASQRRYMGPYPILNATLNLAAGKQLA
jgi:hypothetical protein